MENVRGHDVEVTVGEWGFFGQGLHEVDVGAAINRMHVGKAHHRSADIDRPDFRIGEAFLEGDRHLARTAAEFEDAFDLAIGRGRDLRRILRMGFVLIVGAGIEVVRAVIVDMPREFVADVAARLHVDFMLGIVGDEHLGLQLKRAGAGFVGGLHLCDVLVGVAMELAHHVGPHQLLATQPGLRREGDDRIGLQQSQRIGHRHLGLRIDAVFFEKRDRSPVGSAPNLGLNPGTVGGEEVLVALEIAERQPFKLAEGAAWSKVAGKILGEGLERRCGGSERCGGQR